MKTIIVNILFISLIGILSCEKIYDAKTKITTGVIGVVEYGQGDCMPPIDLSTRLYNKYNGDLYFIVKADLENMVNGDFEQLKENSIKTHIKGGELAIELPVDTFLVMPTDVYLYSDYNTIIIEEGIALEKNFKFWKCTSY
jgi:hypothetical protein